MGEPMNPLKFEKGILGRGKELGFLVREFVRERELFFFYIEVREKGERIMIILLVSWDRDAFVLFVRSLALGH
jgi:hypothetical protein